MVTLIIGVIMEAWSQVFWWALLYQKIMIKKQEMQKEFLTDFHQSNKPFEKDSAVITLYSIILATFYSFHISLVG